jgi:hypothetical protein
MAGRRSRMKEILMDWYRILAMAAVGAVAGGIAGGIASLVFGKDRKTARTVLTAALFAGLMVAGHFLVNPLLDGREKTVELDNALTILDSTPPFLFTKKHDPAGYATLRSEIEKIITEKNGKTTREVEQLTILAGKRVSAGYFRKAPDAVILRYIKNYLAFLVDFHALDPRGVCRLELPHLFGTPMLEELARLPAWKTLLDEMEKVVVAAVAGTTEGPDPASASALFERFRTGFFANHPTHAHAFTEAGPQTTDFTSLSLALQSFYQELVSLPTDEAAAIYRLLRSQ